MPLKKFSIILFFLLLFSSTQAANRVALIIGNQEYINLKTLKNPNMDATAIAKSLKLLGFDIIHPIRNTDVQNDLSESEMLTARNAFIQAATGSQIAFIYYSGHGASLGNHLEAHILPVDIPRPSQTIASLELFQRHALSLNSLLMGLDKKAKLTIGVFDACREIPELENTKSVFRGQWRGLSKIEEKGTRIIAYSGSQGQLVSDGDGIYSPYTQRLLEVLQQKPTLEIGHLFREVATRVQRDTNQKAEVLIQNVPPNIYYLKKPDNKYRGRLERQLRLEREQQKKALQQQRIQEESGLWNITKKCKKIECYQTYLTRYPDGIYSKIAREKVRESRSSINGLVYQNQKFSPIDKSNYNKNVEGGRVWKWQGAVAYCKNLNNVNKWRLPSKEELKRILTKEKYVDNRGNQYYVKNNLINSMPKLGGKHSSVIFWTSTEWAGEFAFALRIDRLKNDDPYIFKNEVNYVLCVRKD